MRLIDFMIQLISRLIHWCRVIFDTIIDVLLVLAIIWFAGTAIAYLIVKIFLGTAN